MIIAIKMKRTNQINMFDPDAVSGILRIYYKEIKDNILKTVTLRTIENKNYLFPPGHYYLELQYSPKFKRNLWEFTDIENRSEIKFHQGSESKHSKGCILLNNNSLHLFHEILKNNKTLTIQVK